MKSDKFTAKLFALMPIVRDDWLKISQATAPVNRANVQRILEQLYDQVNRPPPKNVIYLDSPLQIANAISFLRLEEEASCQEVNGLINGDVRYQVCRQFRAN